MIPNYNDIRYTYGEKSKVCVRTLYKEQSLEKKQKSVQQAFFTLNVSNIIIIKGFNMWLKGIRGSLKYKQLAFYARA